MQHTFETPARFPFATGKKPLGLVASLLLFGIPTLLMFAGFHLGLPALENLGLTAFEAFIVASTVPPALLFAAALGAVVREQGSGNGADLRRAFSTRLRFPRLTLRTLLLGLGLYVAMAAAAALFTPLGRALVAALGIPVPAHVPLLLDPRATLNATTLTRFSGGSLVGNWGIVILFVVQLFFNIAGEELWWRGYILPRQELAFGRRTWLVHGLLWWGFHAFKWWDMVAVLPLALLLSYAAQRTQNNWVPTIAHLLANSLLLLLMLAGVLGLMT